MKVVAWLIGIAAVLGSGGYVFVYLYRWEWHRALIMGIFLVAAEVAVATAVVLRRLGSLSDGQPSAHPVPAPHSEVLARIREAAPQRDHFAWLNPKSGRASVFITMFVGGGILVSGGAWVIDRLASRTGGRRLEAGLAQQLASIAFPDQGFVVDETELLAAAAPFSDDPELRILLGPQSRP